MLFLFLYFTFMCLLVIKSEDNIIKVEILKGANQSCEVARNYTLVEGSNFILNIRSDYFINETNWRYDNKIIHLEHLTNSNVSLIYQRSLPNFEQDQTTTFTYTYSHTRKATTELKGIWEFEFILFLNYDPWLSQKEAQVIESRACNTSIAIVPDVPVSAKALPETSDNPVKWIYIIGPIFGIILMSQTAYIMYLKRCTSKRKTDKGCTSKRKTDKEHEQNEAQRPRLSLPHDAAIEEAALSTKQSYRNKALDTSDEAGPSPGIARRQLKAKLVQILPHPNVCASKSFNSPTKLVQILPHPNVCASKSFKSPNSLPCSPPSKRAPAFQPAHRQEPPPLFSKNLPVFPPAHRQEQPRLSDDEWEYEELQPGFKYINN